MERDRAGNSEWEGSSLGHPLAFHLVPKSTNIWLRCIFMETVFFKNQSHKSRRRKPEGAEKGEVAGLKECFMLLALTVGKRLDSFVL